MQRRFLVCITSSVVCPRCGHDVESDHHRYFTCPDNNNIDDPLKEWAAKMVHYAGGAMLECPALWTRGLVLKALTHVHISPEATDTMSYGDGDWLHGEYFSDASGGPNATDTRLRIVGWGLARIHGVDENATLVIAAAGLLPGKRQTVCRGELYAGIALLLKIKPNGDPDDWVTIWADSSYIVKRSS